MFLHTVRSVLTLLLTVISSFSPSLSLYSCSFYCKKHCCWFFFFSKIPGLHNVFFRNCVMHGAYDKPGKVLEFACWDLKNLNKSVYTIWQTVKTVELLQDVFFSWGVSCLYMAVGRSRYRTFTQPGPWSLQTLKLANIPEGNFTLFICCVMQINFLGSFTSVAVMNLELD